jgi:crotonobetainyl-CoA:carnitine CoA-transferase CaiB-like acyl-CoA transferase
VTHAERVLVDLGLDPAVLDANACPGGSDPPGLRAPDAPHPDDDWAQSGAMWLTGSPNGPPRPMAAPVAACARGIARALGALSPSLAALDLDAPALLGERAALAGLGRGGRATAGGAGRLLRARDGWLAVQLPRPDDFEALPAWLETEAAVDGERRGTDEVFEWLERELAPRSRAVLIERARWLGLAVAALPSPRRQEAEAAARQAAGVPERPASPASAAREAAAPAAHAASTPGPWLVHRPSRAAAAVTGGVRPPPARPAGERPLRVLDLSTLWAGPLCGSLLALGGADVVKLEHRARPDAARSGSRPFFDLMNGGKSNVALDLHAPRDRARLHALIETADVVIESARPRALAQLGVDAERLVDTRPGLTWVSITGYGRAAPGGDRIAFGDDAAVAGGLIARDTAGQPVFCGDAIADPLTGLHAALAALAGARSGGGLYDVSLAGVAQMIAHTRRCEHEAQRSERATTAPSAAAISRPRARAPQHAARTLGADTTAVCERWGRAGRGAAGC